jgi:Ca2+-transporting ATPase
MVLLNDAFSSIVAAIRQGRVILENIRKFVLYLLSCNISEIMVVSLASVVALPLPVRPLQILFLNLVTDVFPALALGVGKGDARVMERRPRDPDESIMTSRHWWGVAGYGSLITLSVLGALLLALNVFEMETDRAVTVSFVTLAFAQLWHVFNMRDIGSGLVRNEITRNPYVWGAVGLSVGLVLMAVYLPGLAELLRVANPGAEGWWLVMGMSMVPLLIGQVFHQVWPMIRSES